MTNWSFTSAPPKKALYVAAGRDSLPLMKALIDAPRRVIGAGRPNGQAG